MFSTLLGALSAHPDRVDVDAAPPVDLDTRIENAAALEAIGLELISDGLGPEPADAEPDDVVARWAAVASAGAAPVKAVLLGPWSASRASSDDGHAASAATVAHPASAVAERLRPTILALAAAGCQFVEIAEPDIASLGTDPGAAAAFAEAHRRLVDGSEGVHCSLALTGANVDAAGPATFFDRAYASYAFDLIAGPDNWRLIAEAPADRGVVCGAIGLATGADSTREVLVWAAHYAASTRGRGLARVGLANAPAAPGHAPPARAEVLRRLTVVAEASRIAAVESGEEMASLLDPRAIDPRSAALGRFAPGRRRASRPRT